MSPLRSLRPRRSPLAALVLVAAACSGGSAPSQRPGPAAQGSPVSPPVSAALGPRGGTIATADGRLIVHVPAGAVRAATSFSVQEITNTAPHGIGTAYRLEPSGATFAVPVAISFQADTVEGVGVSYQDETGFWVPVVSVLRNPATKLVTVSSSHFSSWALVPSNAALDMAGSFRLESTIDVPFTASGTASLGYVGEDDAERYYLQSGTTTLDPVVDTGVACAPADGAAHAFPTNVAEVFKSPARFWWATSGHWDLTCGPASQTLLTAFDTVGITHVRCNRGYTTGAPDPVITVDRLSGDYTIDCAQAGGGQLRATWDFVRCGGACTSANPCATAAAIGCASGAPACTVTATAPVGASCTTGGAPGVCNASGACTSCVEGASCAAPTPCAATATVACGSGAPVCTVQSFQPAGTACSDGALSGVCSGATGICTACTPGAACTSENACAAAATIDCSSGAPVCIDGAPRPAGAPCSSGSVAGVCDGATTLCNACSQGAPCASTDPCAKTATTDCSSGVAVCAVQTYRATGASCVAGSAAGVCSASHVCAACTAGEACPSANPCATAAAVSCDTGAPVCTDAGVLPDGAVCDAAAGNVCLGGACAACQDGAACTPADACHVGVLQCGATPGCVDTGAAAIACAPGQTCQAGRCL